MNKIKTIRLFVCCVFLTSVGLFATEQTPTPKKSFSQSPLLHVLDTKVLEAIQYSSDIPGLTSEEFSTLKTEIIKIRDTLLKDGVLEISGTDKDIRPYFVALQGTVEHVLAAELQKVLLL